VLRIDPTGGPGVYKDERKGGPVDCVYMIEIWHDGNIVQVQYLVDEFMTDVVIIHATTQPSPVA
jgi:hypothetical protein